MRVNANAVLRSWTLLAAFGGSYAPEHTCIYSAIVLCACALRARARRAWIPAQRRGRPVYTRYAVYGFYYVIMINTPLVLSLTGGMGRCAIRGSPH